jgi:hypothetical protein
VPPSWLTIDGNKIIHGQTVDHAGHRALLETLVTPASVVGVAVRVARIDAVSPPLKLEMIPNAGTPGQWAGSNLDRENYFVGDAGAWWIHTETSEQYTDVANGLLAAGYTDVRGGTSFNSAYDQPYAVVWKNDAGESLEIIMEAHLIINVGGA